MHLQHPRGDYTPQFLEQIEQLERIQQIQSETWKILYRDKDKIEELKESEETECATEQRGNLIHKLTSHFRGRRSTE
jgi:hypothetical protein